MNTTTKQSDSAARLGLALILSLIITLLASINAKASTKVIFVIDGSNSMWGQIEGLNKVVIMRQAFARNIKKLPADIELGLIAYGHRSVDGCKDIEVILRGGKGEQKDFIKKLNSIRPRGNTPITNALNIALQQLQKSDNDDYHIVLVTDGQDNCGGNLIRFTDSIKDRPFDIKTHVIAFDVNSKYHDSFRYLADRTNGQFYSSTDVASFNSSLQKLFSFLQENQHNIKQINKITDNNSQSNWNNPQQLRLQAQVAKGAPFLQEGVKWEIVRSYADGQYARQIIRKYDESDVVLGGLNNGQYTAIARYGYAITEIGFEINEQNKFKLQSVIANLKAGGLNIKAYVAGTRTPIKEELKMILTEIETKKGQKTKEYQLDNLNQEAFYRLNAGLYRLIGNYGDVNVQISGDIVIEPGKLTEAIINFRAGKLIFRLINQQTTEVPIENIYWKFFDQNGTLLLATDAVSPSHVFSSGVYGLEVTYNGRNYRSEFTVKSGGNKIVEVLIK